MYSIRVTLSITILAIVGYNSTSQDDQGCTLPLKKQNYNVQPLYFLKEGKSYTLAKPKLIDGEIAISVGETDYLIIVCPERNLLRTEVKIQEIFTAQCHAGQWKVIREWFAKENKDVATFKCDEKINFVIKNKPKENCGHRTSVFEVGFDVLFKSRKLFGMSSIFRSKSSTDWQRVYRICFDTFTKDVLYTIHTMHGDSIQARQKGLIENPKFQFDHEYDLTSGEKINPETSYEMKMMYKALIEDTSLIPYFDCEKKHLMPKTLVPDGDMLFFNWKPASYFYVNTTPMWRNILNVWRNLEEQIRKAAAARKEQWTIYTGVYEKFILCHEPVTLAEFRKAIIVPLYFWKIVYNERTKAGIAFVINNDPHNRDIKPLCTPLDRHSHHGELGHILNSDKYMGETYRCSVQDLREQIRSYKLPEFAVERQLELSSK